jgi:protocatechuate 3,4-dioxygenase beta subunit
VNYSRRDALRLSVLPVLGVLSACGLGLKTGRSGAPNRAVVDTSLMSGNLSCDNSSVPLSDAANRLSTISDFESTGQCILIKDSFEGPFYYCTNPNSAEIAKGKQGDPLIVALRAMDAATCQPLTDAVIDIWHCDASGIYSGYNLGVDEAIAGVRHAEPDNSERACRGALRTDKDGIAEFNSIYPGYYIERATHIHFKAHIGNRSFLTNQAYLPEEINEAIYRLAPYNAPRKAKRILNTDENWSVPTMKVIERQQTRLAVLSLAFVPK